MRLLLWLPMFFVTMVTCAFQECQEAAYSQKEQYLKGHEISSGSAAHIGDCLVKCSNEPRCKSINFRFKGSLCELNNADRFTHPWDYGPGSMSHAYNDYPFKPILKEYYMIPSWLRMNARFIDNSHSLTSDMITFNAGSNHLLLEVPLVAAGALSDETPLAVVITVANDVSIFQSSDSDIWYGLTDGNNFTGFETPDKANYNSWARCFGIEGTKTGTSPLSGPKRINSSFPIGGNLPFPGQFVFTLKLSQERSWGSCFIAQGDGFTKTAEFTKRLKLRRGLALAVYRHEIDERVGIKFIKVTIRKTDD